MKQGKHRKTDATGKEIHDGKRFEARLKKRLKRRKGEKAGRRANRRRK